MERIYTIPLRYVRKAPRTKRAPKAVRYIRAFIEKHMKSSEVKFDSSLNERLWEKGIENIPAKIKVKAAKQEDGSVLLTLAE
jgi:large subunit ribosomal protein L31e